MLPFNAIFIQLKKERKKKERNVSVLNVIFIQINKYIKKERK